MRFRFAFVVFLTLGVNIFAIGQETCTLALSGKLKDREGHVVPGATITVGSVTQVADKRGEFLFPSFCPGTYTLMVRFIGLQDYSVEVNLRENLNLEITLEPLVTELESIEIMGQPSPSGLTNTTLNLAQSDLDKLKGKSLGESLKSLPGISALQAGPSIFKPVIHGLHSQRILILNNGIRQEGQQWGIEHAPEIDPFIASEITVVKGAEAVRFGADAIGGVIIINTPSIHQAEKFGGEINMGYMTNNRMGILSAVLEGGFPTNDYWHWRIQGTAKKGGDFSSPGYVLSNTGMEELNFSGALGYEREGKTLEVYASSFNAEIGILRAAHTGNLDDLEESIRSGTPWYTAPFTYRIANPKQEINHHLLKVRAGKNIAGLGKINLLYGGQINQRKEFDIRRAGRSDRPAMLMRLFSNVLDISLDHDHSRHSGSLGLNVTYKHNYNDTRETGIRPLIPDYRQFSTGLFFIEKIRKKNWLWEAGARYDYQFLRALTFTSTNDLIKPEFNFHYMSGSLGATYYSHLGISSRPPHVSELYSEGLHHGTAAIEEGLMRIQGEVLTDQALIKNERSVKWINTLQAGSEKFSIDLSVYANSIANYVYLRPIETRLTIRGYFPVWHFEQTQALLTGADVLLNWSVARHIQYSGKIAYLHARDVSRNDRLIFIPPANMEHSLQYQNTIGRLENFFVKVSVPTVFRQSRAPRTVYPSEIPDYHGEAVYDLAPPPPAYTLLTIETGFQLPLKDHQLLISVAGENLTNTPYRNYMNRLRYFADDVGRNFIVRLKYTFHAHD